MCVILHSVPLPTEWCVLIFVGKLQHGIPFEITRDAQQLGNRLEWIKIEGDGRNNLDFHLAFHLGRLSNVNSGAEFLVLSKDKGFDPLIKHVVSRGLKCERIETLDQVPTHDGQESVLFSGKSTRGGLCDVKQPFDRAGVIYRARTGGNDDGRRASGADVERRGSG